METFKVKELYIIKPLELLKSKTKLNFDYPYDTFYEMGLIVKDQFELLDLEMKRDKSSNDKLKLKVNYIEGSRCMTIDTAIINEEKQYMMNANDVTLAYLDWCVDGYRDVFSEKLYNIIMPFPHHDEITELVVDPKCDSPELLVNNLYNYEIDKPGVYTEAIKKQMLEEIENCNLTLKQLKQIRESIIAENENCLYTVNTERTKVFYPIMGAEFSYNSKGEKIRPIYKCEVKRKALYRKAKCKN